MPTHAQRLQAGWRQHQAGDLNAAEHAYRAVLDENAKDANAWVYLGILLFDRRHFAESVDAYQQAIELKPRNPIAWNNMGNSHRMLGRVDEAEQCFASSLKQKPGYLSALKNRGTLWVWSGEIERGLQWYQRGLEVDPNNAELHRNLGVIYLLLQDFDRGWPEYRWRWKMPDLQRPSIPAPIWQGESLQGKSIIIYPEQGLGDAIQFVRVATSLKERGATVVLRCHSRLLALFTSAPGIDQWNLEHATPPPVDFQASFIEVVDRLYQQTRTVVYGNERILGSEGYLTVSQALIDYWGKWIDQTCPRDTATKQRVGINWQGNRGHHADVYRSAPLTVLRPLAEQDSLQLFSLQFGDGVDQLDECDFATSIQQLPEHLDTDGGAFTDTAAILKHLDYVVTTDTAIAHLAGAVGTPVKLLLSKVPDWRWGMTGERTPWYPSLRLYRQQKIGQWEPVINQLIP